MATFTAIPEKTQTATTMRRVLDYVMQDKVTVHNGIKLVSGQNCVPESAYQEFMATKHRYGKATDVFFKQYVQSFKPDCGATPWKLKLKWAVVGAILPSAACVLQLILR